MIKIVHTADLHFGLEFSRFPSIADKLKQERLIALEQLVDRGNKAGAHCLVVAGDLFEKLSVPQKLVKDVKAALAKFAGEVIVIPGNHDWYNDAANDNKVWDWFQNAPGTNVHFLHRLSPFSLELNSRKVIFYPCGCHQKHCEENRIGWIEQPGKSTDTIHIGIAHGNVEGYGLDEEGQYFNMSPNELKKAGMDCWLLGHIHAPYPATATAGHEVFFFAGGHCAESWKSERTGGSWLIEIGENKKISGTRWNHSGICFKDRTYKITELKGLQAVLSDFSAMDAANTILRITLSGSLTEDELAEVKNQIALALPLFLYAETPIWKIALKITPDMIDKIYPQQSIPHSLLSKLHNTDDDLAAQLAYETIKELSK